VVNDANNLTHASAGARVKGGAPREDRLFPPGAAALAQGLGKGRHQRFFGESGMPSVANTPVHSYNRIAPQKCDSWARLPSFFAVGEGWTQVFGLRPSARRADRPAPRRAYPGSLKEPPVAAPWFTGKFLGRTRDGSFMGFVRKPALGKASCPSTWEWDEHPIALRRGNSKVADFLGPPICREGTPGGREDGCARPEPRTRGTSQGVAPRFIGGFLRLERETCRRVQGPQLPRPKSAPRQRSPGGRIENSNS
jgi:hypothetical protein